jgi:hypothetical protein
MGRRELFHTFSLLVEIEGHFIDELVSYVYETEDWNGFIDPSIDFQKIYYL